MYKGCLVTIVTISNTKQAVSQDGSDRVSRDKFVVSMSLFVSTSFEISLKKTTSKKKGSPWFFVLFYYADRKKVNLT